MSFFRDSRGLECDLFYETGRGIGAIEIKAGSTITSAYFDSLHRVAKLLPQISAKVVVYGGATSQSRTAGDVVRFTDLDKTLRRL